jgi:hypothetical protein
MATKVAFIGKPVHEGEEILIDGVNPWLHAWKQASHAEFLGSHPSYPDRKYRVTGYQITADGRVVSFWAGKVSERIWAFYRSVQDA